MARGKVNGNAIPVITELIQQYGWHGFMRIAQSVQRALATIDGRRSRKKKRSKRGKTS